MIRRLLAADQRGAVLVVGCFAAALLIGLLYFLLGLGEALHHRAVTQDAADAGAYTMATMHAHAMNLMALFNLVKAAVVAILSALLGIIPAAIIMAIKTLHEIKKHHRYDLIPTLIAFLLILGIASAKYASVQGTGRRVLKAANDGQAYLRETLPSRAEEKAALVVGDHYSPPVVAELPSQDGGRAANSFAWPLRELPTEEGSPMWLCFDRALVSAYGIIGQATLWVPDRKHAREFQGLAVAFSTIACLARGEAQQILQSDAQLGTEPYQLRFFVLARPLERRGESGVRQASWRADEDGGRVVELRDALSRMMFAEGEYFFEGPEENAPFSRREMLWHMGWGARMRRFRFPAGGMNGFQASCARSQAGELCPKLAAIYGRMDGVVVH